MERTKLKALSPADGRYADKVDGLRDVLSEYGLIRYRVLVEVRWLQWLADEPAIEELPVQSSVMKDVLNDIVDGFSTDDAERVKAIESTPVSGVLIRKLAVAPRPAPCLRNELATGITLHEHNGSGMPTTAALSTPPSPGVPR